MRQHNGMRPQDIAILLKIIAMDNQPWQNKDLSWSLSISASEISEFLNRSHIAGLIDFQKKKVSRQSMMEFLEHGLHYVFPAIPGALMNGIPTALSYDCMKTFFNSDEYYIWPDPDGNIRGSVIQPLYPGVVKSVKQDSVLYKLLALADVVRVGKTRELKVAIAELKKIILHE